MSPDEPTTQARIVLSNMPMRKVFIPFPAILCPNCGAEIVTEGHTCPPAATVKELTDSTFGQLE